MDLLRFLPLFIALIPKFPFLALLVYTGPLLDVYNILLDFISVLHILLSSRDPKTHMSCFGSLIVLSATKGSVIQLYLIQLSSKWTVSSEQPGNYSYLVKIVLRFFSYKNPLGLSVLNSGYFI